MFNTTHFKENMFMSNSLDIQKSRKINRTKRTTDMTTGSPAKLLFYFAMPLFIGNILQQFYNLADTSLAGHLLGDTALAQIGATAALYSLITNVAFGLNNGFALFVSRNFGADNKTEMKHSVCWAVLLSALSTLILTASFLIFRRPLLTLLQVPAETMDGALSYLTVILAGIPLTMAYNLESSLLRSIGNSITPLIFLVFSSVLNVILDYLFMGPFSMGVRGAAIATITAQGISAILGLFCILHGYPELKFGKKDMKVSVRFVFEMFWTGLSMALMSAIYNIGSVILQGSINALGNVYIAAQVGGRRLAEFFYTPGIALGTSAATFASQNYGARKNSRIKKGIYAAIEMYGIWWILAMISTFTIARSILVLITGSSDNTIISNGLMYLRISIPMIPPMAILVIVRNALQGMRHSVAPLLCSALEMIGKIIFAVFLVPVYGYIAVCICEPVTWVVCFLFIMGAVLIFRADFRNPAEL